LGREGPPNPCREDTRSHDAQGAIVALLPFGQVPVARLTSPLVPLHANFAVSGHSLAALFGANLEDHRLDGRTLFAPDRHLNGQHTPA